MKQMSTSEKVADFWKYRSGYSKQAKINLIEKSGPVHNIKENFNELIFVATVGKCRDKTSNM